MIYRRKWKKGPTVILKICQNKNKAYWKDNEILDKGQSNE